jgi:CelD/BcsL family acetyltransferase involved in cellulose biosynthesis
VIKTDTVTTRSGHPSPPIQDAGSPPGMETLATLVVSELGAFRAAWDSLAETLPVACPFLRSWWLDHAAGPHPLFVLVLEGSTLVGGVALEQDRRWGVARLRVQGAGALCPDHFDLLAAPGREAAVNGRIAAWLGAGGSRVIDLEGVVEHARIRAALPPPVREEVIDVAPWASVSSSAPEWFAQLPASLRKTVRTASRRLAAAGIAHRVVGDPQGAGAALDALRRLHAERWGRRSRFLRCFERFASAARAGMGRGELVLHELASRERVVAVLASFEVAGRASLYQWGRDPDPAWGGLGAVLLTRAFERSCELGSREVDLLRGSEPYKQRFAPCIREVVRLRAAHGRAGRSVLALLLLQDRAKQLARTVRGTIRAAGRGHEASSTARGS